MVYQRLGRYEEAATYHGESLVISRDLGALYGQGESLRELGVTLRALGRHREARAHWLEALATFERLGSTDAEQVRALLAAPPARPATTR
jgi:tetratricopeptide (TPR) repeat protein